MSKESNTSQVIFNKLSSKEWWDKIDNDLKGKPREDLFRQVVGELRTKPFYHYDESNSDSATFQYQKRDSSFISEESWLLGQKFFLKKGNEKDISRLIGEAIKGDSQYLEINFNDDFDYYPVLEALAEFKGQLILNCDNAESLEKCFIAFNSALNISIIVDPNYTSYILKNSFENLIEKFSAESMTIPINSNYFVDAGANEIQEGVLILASLNEMIGLIAEKNLKAKFLLRLNTGSNFFLQIAKFRAIRKLSDFILKEWEIESEPIIEAQSSKWNKSVYDRFTNILRLSSESFSAIVGGVDVLNISGFEESLKIENEFTHRNARNISHLLKHESHLDKVFDHAAGSYFIENLTQEYSKLIWDGFREIEKEGGIRKYNSRQSIVDSFNDSKKENQKLFGEGKIKMLGTNSFPNPLDELTKENILDRLPSRLANNFEKLRSAVDLKSIESNGNRPLASLLRLGMSEMRFARAGFATNFLECAGIRIKSSDEISDELKEVNIAVLCSGDDEYLENAAEWATEIKSKYPQLKLILAGNPQNKKELEKSGVDFFIHLKAPLENTLIEILKSIGIEKA